MNKLLKLILSFSVFFSLSISVTRAADVPVLAVEDSWPPYAGSDGKGLATSLVVEAYRAIGIEPEVHVKPYARVLKETEDGKVDGGYNVTRQASTEAVYHFEATPLLQASASLYTKPGRNSDFKKLEDLPDGFRMGLIVDYEYGDQYEQQRSRFNEIRVNTQRQLIQMVLSERLDGIILFNQVAYYTLREMGERKEALNAQFINHVSDIYVAFNKHDRVSIHWARELERGLKKIRKQGTYDKIFSGALVSDYQPITAIR